MMSTSHQPVLLTILDGPSPKDCNPWDGFTLGQWSQYIHQLNPAIPLEFQKFDKHRYQILWDVLAKFDERKGEGWRRVVGAIIDGVGAEAAGQDGQIEAILKQLCDSVATEPSSPDFLRVGFYAYIIVADPQTQFQAEMEQAVRDVVELKFRHLPSRLYDVQAVSDPKALLKALEEGIKQMCRNYRISQAASVAHPLVRSA